jgi:hypothetical protein
MSWLGYIGSNLASHVAAAVGVPSRARGGAAKDIPNAVNSGIGVPFDAKADAEERARGNDMKMQRVTAAGATKAKPNDAIARQFGM